MISAIDADLSEKNIPEIFQKIKSYYLSYESKLSTSEAMKFDRDYRIGEALNNLNKKIRKNKLGAGKRLLTNMYRG